MVPCDRVGGNCKRWQSSLSEHGVGDEEVVHVAGALRGCLKRREREEPQKQHRNSNHVLKGNQTELTSLAYVDVNDCAAGNNFPTEPTGDGMWMRLAAVSRRLVGCEDSALLPLTYSLSDGSPFTDLSL